MDLQPFRDFLLVREGRSKETVRNYVDALRRFHRDYQFDLALFISSPANAQREGDRVLARLRMDREGPNAFNLGQKAFTALARHARAQHPDPATSLTWKGVEWNKLPSNDTQPRPFTEWELGRLLAYQSRRGGWKGREETRRRRALVWFALYTAMRHGEIHRAKASHLDPIANRYRVQKPSKNAQPRILPVEAEFFSSGRPLQGWLKDRPLDPSDPDWLWTTQINGPARKPGKPHRLSYARLGDDFKAVGRTVNVDVNFYRTRATRATQLKLAGMEDRSIQQVLGHDKLETTTRYVRWLMVDLNQDFARHTPATFIKRPPKGAP